MTPKQREQAKLLRLGKIPHKNYKRPKKPEGMTFNEWALSVFKPNPKYKEPFPKWLFYARVKYERDGERTRYECCPIVAFSKKDAVIQTRKYVKMKRGELLRLWRDSPMNWDSYKKPWVRQ